jgi:hypothetical protein
MRENGHSLRFSSLLGQRESNPSPQRNPRASRTTPIRPKGPVTPKDEGQVPDTPKLIWNCPYLCRSPVEYAHCKSKELANIHRVKCVHYPSLKSGLTH